jgi:hypothetical protein
MTERTIPGSNVPPTAAEWAVFSELAIFHRSSKYPLPLARLCSRTGLSEREAKAAIEGLRKRHAVAVGASRGKLFGYFLAESAEDLDLALKAFRRQLISEGRTVRVFFRHNDRAFREFWGQMALEIEKESVA